MTILNHFPHKCTIRRRVRTKGNLIGSKDSFTNEQTDVVCWDQSANSREVDIYQKRGMEIDHKVFFLSNPSISSRHQILITEMGGNVIASPIALDVVSEPGPDTSVGAGILWKVMCVQVTSGET